MLLQQGDVLLKSVKSIPQGSKKIERTNSTYGKNRYVLAAGEVTGHCHAIKEEVDLFEKNNTLYLETKGGETLEHEEHGNITLPAGTWEIGIVQEYDHFGEEARRVQD